MGEVSVFAEYLRPKRSPTGDLRKTKVLDQFLPAALSLSDIKRILNQVPGLTFSCIWIEEGSGFLSRPGEVY